MNNKIKLYFHFSYWALVVFVLTLVFGMSWGNNMAAFYFVCMLLPIVLGTSYFFNYFLVPKYFINKRFVEFGFYTICTVIVSLYLNAIVLLFSFIYLGNFSFSKLGPHAADSILMAVIMYFLVFMGSFGLMLNQLKENRRLIKELVDENNKMKVSFIEVTSNRKTVRIPYADIIYIESLSDFIRITTINNKIDSKEKISKIEERLSKQFIRIHRSFIINTEKITRISYNEITVIDTTLNIGRSYRSLVKERLQSGVKK